MILPPLHSTGNISRGYNTAYDPNAIVRNTDYQDVPGYLEECRRRTARGWQPNCPISFAQMLAGYKAHLSPYRPAAGEPGAELFEMPAVLSDQEFDSMLHSLKVSPLRRKALRVVLAMRGDV
ncbi:hypothetical protein [Rubinisphaera sp.]|uniref:hypothetical protein n=1 Tax=Rubinisphaera sp. TaxID=2024857 RepID=UPI000C0F9F6A|nr:hypothetical protein [Rubinisphaera sp.]MBV07803.1 hypothetical protein [Rubinisphaera sp.]HCS50951.1 hypothetical protein [Planctomycetaceae bacterium]|tara:strand:- start:2253 stop:2618 length:366 start_codon:yes stop_codon:yes gene_type:complete